MAAYLKTESYPSRYVRKEGFTTPLPHTQITAYKGFHIQRVRGTRSATSNYDSQYSSWWLQAASGDPYESYHITLRNQARSQAVIKFNQRANEKASLGVAMAEARKSTEMITKRVTQLYNAAKALRTFRFYDAAEALGLLKQKKPRKARLKGTKLRWRRNPVTSQYYPSRPVTSKERRSAHAFANTWLEWSFGWSPLISDITTSAKVLSEPLRYETVVKGSGRITASYLRTHTVPGGTSGFYDTVYRNRVSVTHGCRSQAVLTVTNPNKDLASRLGLTDLAGIAVEIVPFSFVLNWFTNLNEFATQFSPVYGVKTERKSTCYTDYCACDNDSEIELINLRNGYKNPNPLTKGPAFKAVSVQRYPGELPSVTFGIRPHYHLGFQRALTQSSLLVTLFTRNRARNF